MGVVKSPEVSVTNVLVWGDHVQAPLLTNIPTLLPTLYVA
jgi:hypothetical protein